MEKRSQHLPTADAIHARSLGPLVTARAFGMTPSQIVHRFPQFPVMNDAEAAEALCYNPPKPRLI